MSIKYLPPFPVFRAFDSVGKPLNGGKLFSYVAGSTTPLATYTDEGGATPNANPVILDSTGTANVWLTGALYKLVLKDSNDVTQWTVDNIAGVINISTAMQPVVQAATVAAALALLGGIDAAALAAAIAAAQTPPGTIQFTTSTVAPAGYVAAQGQLLTRTSFAALWAFAQSSGNISVDDASWTDGKYSPGNGSTTFRIPNMQGYFIRGVNTGGSGVDPSRTVGSIEADAIKSHSVPITVTDVGHLHTVGTSSGYGAGGGGPEGFIQDDGGTNVSTALAVTGITAAGAYTGATETRAINLGYLACIKT